MRLVIDAYDGRELEIPLEIWQVDVIREMLGLSVDTTNLDTYCMRSKEQTNETNLTDLIVSFLSAYFFDINTPLHILLWSVLQVNLDFLIILRAGIYLFCCHNTKPVIFDIGIWFYFHKTCFF